jgi:hypothetical protein
MEKLEKKVTTEPESRFTEKAIKKIINCGIGLATMGLASLVCLAIYTNKIPKGEPVIRIKSSKSCEVLHYEYLGKVGYLIEEAYLVKYKTPEGKIEKDVLPEKSITTPEKVVLKEIYEVRTYKTHFGKDECKDSTLYIRLCQEPEKEPRRR